MSAKIRKELPGLHKASWWALALVIFQGVLGGATVLVQISPLLSTLHLITSHVFYAVLVYMYFQACQDTRPFPRIPAKLVKLTGIALVLLFIQICLGGLIRHFGAGPACGLGWKAAILCQEMAEGPLTLWPSEALSRLNMLHRLNGFFVLFALIGLTVPSLKFARINKIARVRWLIIGIHLVVTVQVLLGMKVLGTYISNFAVTLHLAFGLLLWTMMLALYFKYKNGAKA